MPLYDYTCEECEEVFEVSLSTELVKKRPIVICPICDTGNTRKIIVMPATTLKWWNSMASDGVNDVHKRHRGSIRHKRRRDHHEKEIEDYGNDYQLR